MVRSRSQRPTQVGSRLIWQRGCQHHFFDQAERVEPVAPLAELAMLRHLSMQVRRGDAGGQLTGPLWPTERQAQCSQLAPALEHARRVTMSYM